MSRRCLGRVSVPALRGSGGIRGGRVRRSGEVDRGVVRPSGTHAGRYPPVLRKSLQFAPRAASRSPDLRGTGSSIRPSRPASGPPIPCTQPGFAFEAPPSRQERRSAAGPGSGKPHAPKRPGGRFHHAPNPCRAGGPWEVCPAVSRPSGTQGRPVNLFSPGAQLLPRYSGPPEGCGRLLPGRLSRWSGGAGRC